MRKTLTGKKLLSLLLSVLMCFSVIPTVVFATAVEGENVAQIGNDKYATLADAVAAAKDGETVKLIADTDISEKSSITVSKNITLDLNGKVLKAANTNDKGYITIENSTLTLKDSTDKNKNGTGTGKIYTETKYTGASTTKPLITAYDNGHFVMESGLIDSASADVLKENNTDNGQFAVGVYPDPETDANATATVNGGHIKAGWYALAGNGKSRGDITVNGGIIESVADYAIYSPQVGTTTINGGVIYGAAGGISLNRGKLVVNGGTVTSKGIGSTGTWGDGTGGQCKAAINLNAKYGDITCEIYGGKFTAVGEAVTIAVGTAYKSAIGIYGGTFSSEIPTDYCADGFEPVNNGDGTFGVKSMDAVAEVNGTNYYSLQEALDAAKENATVTLLSDIIVGNQLKINKALTLDLNEKKIDSKYPGLYAAGANRYAIYTNAAATVKNGTVVAKNARAIGAYADIVIDGLTVDGVQDVDHANVAFCKASGTCAITNSKITGSYAFANFANNATIKITNSKLNGTGNVLYHNGQNFGLNLNVEDTTINVIDGNGENDSCGVYISGSVETFKLGAQKATFKNCTINGKKIGMEVKYTDLTLIDCNVSVDTNEEPSYSHNNNGPTSIGFAVVSTDSSNNSDVAPAPKGTVTITGNGNYTGLIGLGSLASVKNKYPDFKDATFAISGGTFSNAVPKEYCADGFEAVANENGTYTVTNKYVAKIGDKYYETIDGALTDLATNGGELTLLDNCTTTNEEATKYDIAKAAVIDLNGKILEFKGNYLQIRGETTVKDSVGTGKITSDTYYAIFGNFSAKLTIENAVIEGTYKAGITIGGGGSLLINGGKITGVTNGVDTNGNLTVKAGEISSINYSYNSDENSLVIGEIGADYKKVRIGTLTANRDNLNINFNSGIIGVYSTYYAPTLNTTENSYFGSEFTKGIPAGKKLAAVNKDGKTYYQITDLEESEIAATVTAADGTVTKYINAGEAAKGVKAGGTLTLFKDYNGILRISVDGSVKVDLNGHTVTNENGKAIWASVEGTSGVSSVEIINGTLISGKSSALLVDADGTTDVKTENVTLNAVGAAIALEGGARVAFEDEAEAIALVGNGYAITVNGTNYVYGFGGLNGGGLNCAAEALPASGGTIKLLADYTGNEIVRFNVSGKDVILDLNGKTYTCTLNTTNGVVLLMKPNLKLTLKNGTIKSDTAEYAVYAHTSGGDERADYLTLTLDGVTLEAGKNGFGINGNMKGNVTTIKNSVINAGDTGIYYPAIGTLNIENSKITGTKLGVAVKGGAVSISGNDTSISATADEKEPTEYYNGSSESGLTAEGYAVYVEGGYNDRDITLNISGGTFSSNGAAVKKYIEADDTSSRIRKISISGGRFSSEVPAELCATNYKPFKATNGTYTVGKIELSRNMTLENSLTMTYTAKSSEYKVAYGVFSFYNDDIGDYVDTTVYPTEDTTGIYRLAFKGINPQRMMDGLKLTIFLEKDSQLFEYVLPETTVKDYLVWLLTNYENYREVISNLVAYGAAAQEHMNYRKNELITNAVTAAGVTLETKSYIDTIDSTTQYSKVDRVDGGVKIASRMVILHDSVHVRIYFELEGDTKLEDVTFKATGLRETVFTSTDFKREDNRYYIEFTDVMATEFDDQIVFTSFVNGSENDKYTYNVNSSLASLYNTEPTYKNIAEALFNYGCACNNFIKG